MSRPRASTPAANIRRYSLDTVGARPPASGRAPGAKGEFTVAFGSIPLFAILSYRAAGLPGRRVPSDQHSPPTRAVKAAISVLKVFSATMQRDRERLGDRVSDWLAENPQLEVLQTIVSLSSDSSYHCLSFVLICAQRPSL